jgi:hypothetical protein
MARFESGSFLEGQRRQGVFGQAQNRQADQKRNLLSPKQTNLSPSAQVAETFHDEFKSTT